MDSTERIRKKYDRTSRYYDLMGALMEKGKMRDWRKAIWRKVQGRVLEVGVGTGRNIPFYPHNAEITAIDFSEKMLEKARERAADLNKNIDLRLMDVQKLEFPDNFFDAVVTTCVFCSVPDPVKGLSEIRRVCKNDGKIIMLEHVRSEGKILGPLMDLLNPLTVMISGANINRDTVGNLKKAGIHVLTENNLVSDIVKHISCLNKAP